MRFKYFIHLGLILGAGLLAAFLPELPQTKTGAALNPGDTPGF